MEPQVGIHYGSTPFARTAGRSSSASNRSQQWHAPVSEMVMPTQDGRSGLVSAIDDDFNFADPEAPSPYLPSSSRQANPAISTFLETDAPWNPLDNSSSRKARSATASIPTHEEFMEMPSQPGSESQSVVSMPLEQADSGYYEGPYENRDDSLTVGLEMPPLKRNSVVSESPSHPKAVQENSQETKVFPRSKQNEYPCQQCPKVLKCRSDLRKHERWHMRPFKCDVTGCERSQGFITQNDLDRHKKSKHYNGVYGKTKSYQCAGSSCRNPSKIWPRLDNFKQHVSKMHPDENTDDVIRRSRLATPAPVEDSGASAIDPTAITKSPPRVNSFQDLDQSPASPKSPIDQSRLSPTSAMNSTYSRPSRMNGGHPPLADPEHNQPTTGVDALLTAAAIGNATATQANSQAGINPSAAVPNPDFLNSFSSALNVMTALVSAMQGVQNPVVATQPSPQPSQQPVKGSSSKSRSSSKNQATSPKAQSPPANGPADMFKLLETVVSTMKQAQASQDQDGAEPEDQSKDDAGQKCTRCSKILRRNCDMNKHMKRHTKPYGCTFEDCEKVFGSKNDWKRHENSQHFQGELWKCQEFKEGKHFNKCEFAAHYEAQMMKHLSENHFMDEFEAKRATSLGHIGRNNQMRFWCGFCGKAVPLESNGVGAWDERFNHIDKHFMKDGKRVDEWVDPVKYRTKLQMREDKEQKKAVQSQAILNARDAEAQSKGKRAASPSHPDGVTPAKRSKSGTTVITSMMFHCCRCDHWENAIGSPRCGQCQHPRCGNCLSEIINGSTQ